MRENGQSFIGIAKSLWDQSFHSKRAASAARTSAIDRVTYHFLELTSLTGLNILLGQSNSPQDRVRAVYV